MPTTVIFDLDGVLVDSRAVFLSCVDYAFDKLGLPRARPTRNCCRTSARRSPTGSASCSASRTTRRSSRPASTAIASATRPRSLTETTVAPGIPEALDALNAHRLAVATSKPYALAEPLLGAMGIREHFEVVAGPGLSARAEGKTETLGRALQQLGAPRAVMVGDRSFDILAARAHGLPSIGVTWGIGDAEELTDRRRRPADRARPRSCPRRQPSCSARSVRGRARASSASTRSRSGCTSAPPSSASARRSRSPSASRSRSSWTRATCRSSTT